MKFQVPNIFSFKTFVDLTQPVVIFKCDQAYIQQRLFLLADKFEKKEKGSMVDPVKQEFMNIIQDAEFMNPKLKKKTSTEPPEVVSDALTNSKFTDEINEYTDTLSTWVRAHSIFLKSPPSNYFQELRLINNRPFGHLICFVALWFAQFVAQEYWARVGGDSKRGYLYTILSHRACEYFGNGRERLGRIQKVIGRHDGKLSEEASRSLIQTLEVF